MFLLDDASRIDVCPNNGNLVVAGDRKYVKIFDKRQSKIVNTSDKIEASKLRLIV